MGLLEFGDGKRMDLLYQQNTIYNFSHFFPSTAVNAAPRQSKSSINGYVFN